jgi:hypothetical protein
MMSQKKNFRSHRCRDQESLLIKQRKDGNIVCNSDMGVGTSDYLCGEKVGWGFGWNLPGESAPPYSDTWYI